MYPHQRFASIAALLAAMFGAAMSSSAAQPATQPASSLAWSPIGGDTFDGWQNLTITDGIATLPAGGAATFRYPLGAKGWTTAGFRVENDSTRDWRSFYGVQLDVRAPRRSACGAAGRSAHTPADASAGIFARVACHLPNRRDGRATAGSV